MSCYSSLAAHISSYLLQSMEPGVAGCHGASARARAAMACRQDYEYATTRNLPLVVLIVMGSSKNS